MKKIYLIPLIILISLFFITVNVEASTTTIVYDDYGVTRFDITGVSYSKLTPGVIQWQRDTNAPLNNLIDRGWVSWNISEFNATDLYITSNTLLYDGVAYFEPTDVLIINYTGAMDLLTAQEQYDYCGNGTVVTSNSTSLPTVGDNQTVVLSDDAGTDLSKHISWLRSNGFELLHLSFKMNNETVDTNGGNQIDIVGATPAPTLDIDFENSEFAYTFSDTYYENGTLRVPAVNVTATGDGFITTFNTSGGTVQVFQDEPTLFFWDIGSSTTRRIYSAGPEAFNVTMPESAFDTFVFTIRDFTGKTAKGSAYLEAWRIINTTDTLIERQIVDVHNEVPLNLVIGATYTIRIRYYDDSSEVWGSFVPGDSTTFTIILRGVDFSDQAYQISNFITVDITRTGGTLFTVDYEATKNQTIWANVTIQVRNGAVVTTVSRTNNSFTYNYAGALANTSYIILIEGDHSLLDDWGYTRIFDATETYPDVPDFETIFPMGVLNASNLIGWILTVGAGGLTFSVNMKRGALIAMSVIASFMTLFGFTDWSVYLLSLLWVFSILVYIGSADRT